MADLFPRREAGPRQGVLASQQLRKLANEEAISAKKPDRKSTRLNSSHSQISYAVFCLKKKKKKKKKNSEKKINKIITTRPMENRNKITKAELDRYREVDYCAQMQSRTLYEYAEKPHCG